MGATESGVPWLVEGIDDIWVKLAPFPSFK
jgi:hypothetical protein